ncbi:MAG: hypothetical protein AAFR91_09270 [Pseudomonadota bacterium]
MEDFSQLTRRVVVERNLVDRYLMDQLTEEQAMAFEDFYAGCPETMAELDISERLIRNLKHTDTDDVVVVSLDAQRSKNNKNRVARFLSSPAYSAVASMVAVAALALLGMNQSIPEAMPLGTGNVPVEYLDPTRGSDTGLEIAMRGSDSVLLKLDLGLASDEAYQARVIDTDGRSILTIKDLQVDDSSALTVLLRAEATQPGAYRINVRNVSGETWVFPYTLID